MQFLQTNAINFNALLIEIRDFLAGNGWAILADGTGGGGLTLEMTNANGHDFKLDGATVVATNEYIAGALVPFNDRFCNMSFQKSDIGLAAGYTAFTAETNDCAGPFGNVWLFTDDAATYCHVVLQTGGSRYNHFSFGNLDPKGVHAINIPYCAGMYYMYWRNQVGYIANAGNPFNYPTSGFHNVGYFCEDTPNGKAMRVGLPDGVVDPLLGFTDGGIEKPELLPTCLRQYTRGPGANLGVGRLLDFFTTIDNKAHTGGVPISPLPVLVKGIGDVYAYVGDIPTIGLVNMTGLSVGQELTFAGDTWIVFPLKQYGLEEATAFGNAPQPVCNSRNFGFAIQKV
jgi:hypothetical protein